MLYYVLVDEGDVSSLRCNVGQFLHLDEHVSIRPQITRMYVPTYKSASTTTDEHHEFRQVRGIVRKGVACIVDDGDVCACRKDGQGAWYGQWKSTEVSDRIVRHAMHCEVLERDDSVVNGCNRDCIDCVAGARGVP